RLAHQVRADHRQQPVHPLALARQRMAERGLRRAAAWPDDEVDMGHFVAVTDQRLADRHLGNLRHVSLPLSALVVRLTRKGFQIFSFLSTARIFSQAQASKLATVRSATLPGLKPRRLRL